MGVDDREEAEKGAFRIAGRKFFRPCLGLKFINHKGHEVHEDARPCVSSYPRCALTCGRIIPKMDAHRSVLISFD